MLTFLQFLAEAPRSLPSAKNKSFAKAIPHASSGVKGSHFKQMKPKAGGSGKGFLGSIISPSHPKPKFLQKGKNPLLKKKPAMMMKKKGGKLPIVIGNKATAIKKPKALPNLLGGLVKKGIKTGLGLGAKKKPVQKLIKPQKPQVAIPPMRTP